jgi:microsomal dipeptidase-like Zn-dependent dipeptidase
MRTSFVKPLAVLATCSLCLAIAGDGTSASEQQDSNARARRIHAETIGIDSHIDTLQRVLNGKEDIARLEDVSKMPGLTAVLLERGYSEQDVKKILSGNFLRVMREAIGR